MMSEWTELGRSLAVVGAGALAGLLVYLVLRLIFSGLTRSRRGASLAPIQMLCRAPARLLFPLLGVRLALPRAFDQDIDTWLHALDVAIIAAIAFLVLRLLRAATDIVSAGLGVERPDNLNARRVLTQLRVIRDVLAAIVVLVAAVGMLFTFPDLRRLGTTMLASAGVAGVVIGFSAQRVLANLLAGFQIGFTQPIRLDDVVVLEGEWGRIEEITLTYVVVAIWDQRRLVLPISYFLDKPFQNWTRQTSEILGTVFLYVDFDAPVSAIRDELQRIVEKCELWDGRVCVLQVTDIKEHTVELRALVSARNSGTAFDLRCIVREKLLLFIQENYPDCRPRFRAELTRDVE
jgi:small-conductance mechanosensitive channel